jgi:hypothetical protein
MAPLRSSLLGSAPGAGTSGMSINLSAGREAGYAETLVPIKNCIEK